MSMLTYGFRVNKIFNDESKTAYFKVKEIVNAIVNLIDAKKVLTDNEYFYVLVFYETFRKCDKKLLLAKKGFVDLCNDISAHFDLIAPYYKFCGSSKLKVFALVDSVKQEYRKRAKVLLQQKAIFKEEWMQLHKEFMETF